jgi:hypothetical protein
MLAKTTEAHEPEIYREVVVATLARTGITVFVVLTLFLLVMFVYLSTTGSSGNKPMPNWVYLEMGLLFALFAFVTFLIYNFSKLTISATSQSITVRCGMFKKVMRWEDIGGCYLNDVSPFDFYSGWGIRIGRVNGKRRLVYNVLGDKCVVLGLKKGKVSEFVFSTKNPDAVMDVVRGRIKSSSE